MVGSVSSEIDLEVLKNAFLAQFGFPPPGDSGRMDAGTLADMTQNVEATMLMCGERLHWFLREHPGPSAAIRIIKANLEQRLILVKLFPSLRPSAMTISLLEATLQEAERVLQDHPADTGR